MNEKFYVDIGVFRMFGFSGAALSKIRHMQNGGKRGRHSVDQWDRQSTLNLLYCLPADTLRQWQ